MSGLLEEAVDQLIVTSFENERADSIDHLVSEHALIIDDWHEAIEKAEQNAENGTVLITGSLYFISTVRQYLTD